MILYFVTIKHCLLIILTIVILKQEIKYLDRRKSYFPRSPCLNLNNYAIQSPLYIPWTNSLPIKYQC